MYYMLIANLHSMSKDVYINAHMVIIMIGDDWLYHALFCDAEM